MFRAAMPDSDRIKTTAQLTSGADSWSSPNSFTAQQLWEWMPVDIYLQTFGTTNTIPKLAELTSSGKRMREGCSTAQWLSDTVELYAYAQQLLECMPVDLYLQVIGTTNNIPNLAELTSSGKRMLECCSRAQIYVRVQTHGF